MSSATDEQGSSTRRESPGPAGHGPGDDRSRRGTFLVVLFGLLPLPMSMSGASIAIPHIGADLDTGGAAAQWVVTGYFLTASALMLLAGSLADALGRRRIYRLGALTYAAGSLAAALAPTIGALLAARVLTGIGSAGVMASGGAILAATFSGPARTKAFAAMGAVAGVGLALGPSVSGWIVEALDWRLTFGVFGLAGLGLFAGTWLIRETRAEVRPSIDFAGAVVIAATLAGLMLAVAQGPARGWTDPLVLGALGIAVVGMLVLVPIERRAARPALEPDLFRHRRFMGWLLAATTVAFGYGGALAFLPSYLQSPVGHSAGTVGLIMLLPTAPMIIIPTFAAKLINHGASPAILITIAMLLLAVGNAWLSVLHPTITIPVLAAPLLTLGLGVGLAGGIIDAQAMNQIDADRSGLAAGMLNTVRGGANAIVLALFGAALVALLTTALGPADLAGRVATGNIPAVDEQGLAGHLTDAWRITLRALAALCALAAVAIAMLVRDATPRKH
ncbi:MAG: MFS transporter [Propionibacteriaceae bacterium]